ncbi:uncharacterized protein RSE6_10775 [Rhynchosporium secalis]|uniref:Uncharacterized protein n=1 Tax=Rhynchosporium secalis TaxID=38038 RepID=A0A1E1MMB4_RHYSE|nr:uncharacterized protein RSE6_10775 [Rhynchosporium secalis]
MHVHKSKRAISVETDVELEDNISYNITHKCMPINGKIRTMTQGDISLDCDVEVDGDLGGCSTFKTENATSPIDLDIFDPEQSDSRTRAAIRRKAAPSKREHEQASSSTATLSPPPTIARELGTTVLQQNFVALASNTQLPHASRVAINESSTQPHTSQSSSNIARCLCQQAELHLLPSTSRPVYVKPHYANIRPSGYITNRNRNRNRTSTLNQITCTGEPLELIGPENTLATTTRQGNKL